MNVLGTIDSRKNKQEEDAIYQTARLNNEASSFIQLGKLQDSIKLLNKALILTSTKRRHWNLNRNNIHAFHQIEIAETPHNYKIEGTRDEGMTTFNSPLYIRLSDEPDPLHQIIVDAVIYYNMAITLTRLEQEDEAKPYFNKSISLGNSYLSYVHVRSEEIFPLNYFYVSVLHNLGHISYREGDHEEALSKYQNAMEIIDQSRNRSHVHKALCLNCMAIVKMQTHSSNIDSITNALDHLEKALHLLRSDSTNSYQQEITATILNNAGRAKVLKGDFDEAIIVYEEAVEIREKIYGKEHLDTFSVYFNMAEAFHLSGQNDEALKWLHKFLSVASSFLGEDKMDLIAIYIMIADIYCEAEDVDVDMATKFYKKALHKYEVIQSMDHPDVASILNKLGNLYYENGDLKSAVKAYEEGLVVERKIYSSYNPNILVTILNIARTYHRDDKLELALEKYEEGIYIQSELKGDLDLDRASSLINIGMINSELGRFEAAIKSYKEALVIKREVLGEEDYEVSTIQNSIGIVCFRQGHYQESLDYFKASLSIRRQSDLSDLGNQQNLSNVIYNIATVYFELNDSKNCLQLLNRRHSLERTTPERSDDEITQSAIFKKSNKFAISMKGVNPSRNKSLIALQA